MAYSPRVSVIQLSKQVDILAKLKINGQILMYLLPPQIHTMQDYDDSGIMQASVSIPSAISGTELQ